MTENPFEGMTLLRKAKGRTNKPCITINTKKEVVAGRRIACVMRLSFNVSFLRIFLPELENPEAIGSASIFVQDNKIGLMLFEDDSGEHLLSVSGPDGSPGRKVQIRFTDFHGALADLPATEKGLRFTDFQHLSEKNFLLEIPTGQ